MNAVRIVMALVAALIGGALAAKLMLDGKHISPATSVEEMWAFCGTFIFFTLLCLSLRKEDW